MENLIKISNMMNSEDGEMRSLGFKLAFSLDHHQFKELLNIFINEPPRKSLLYDIQ